MNAQKKMLAMWEAMQNKCSKFYEQDRREYIIFLNGKTDAQLNAMVERQTEIKNIPAAAIAQNCQFGGLRKIGR